FTIAAIAWATGILDLAFKIGSPDNGDLHIFLIASAIVAGIISVINGYKWSYLEAGMIASINRSMQAVLILLTVGLLIGSWIAAGVVPALIYYGMIILKPSIFLLASCVLCSIVSLATGSSWTTAGTIGIALIGIGIGLQINPAMTAGAIVSGAYFGDKMSPLSDTTNLAPAVAGTNLFDHIRHMIWTVTPSLILALIGFGILGAVNNSGGNADLGLVNAMQDAIAESFNITPLLLIPPVVVILIVAFKLPALPGLFGGIILGCIFGGIFQDVPFGAWSDILHYGYSFSPNDAFYASSDSIMAANPAIATDFEIASLDELSKDAFGVVVNTYDVDFATQAQYQLTQLLSRGGLDGMLWSISLILCAMCFGGILDASGMLAQLAGGLLKIAKSRGMLVLVTIFTCIFMNIIAGDQYLAILLPGRMYKEAFEDRKLKAKNLSRILEDSGTITSCLIPWNTCGATMASFLGVSAWSATGGYGMYAFLNLINPVVSAIYGFTGISMEKMSDEEYAKILEHREREKEEALANLKA
ncbi:MAG: Na+/H+ antiporter NhaC family protein, partial [Anaerovoracaceae bacterium]